MQINGLFQGTLNKGKGCLTDMRYCVLFPEAQNVHLVKDVGMIPYKLNQLYNYQALLATYNNGAYPYLQDEVSGLKLDFIQRFWHHPIWDGLNYLRGKGKEIDVLQIFHMTLSSVFFAYFYKFINPKGKIFLKLDCSSKLIEKLKSLGIIELKLLNLFLKKVNLIGVEQEKLYHDILRILPAQREKISYLPNGVDFTRLDSQFETLPLRKENILLTVARLGSQEKNTSLLLEAFARLAKEGNMSWKLVLVGPVDPEFEAYLQSFWLKYPALKLFVEFKGALEDRRELWSEYRRAKIFCLTSDYESFGFALIEAAAAGTVIVSTDVGIASELVQKGNGAVVRVRDLDALTKKLAEFMERPDLEELCGRSAQICREKFNWDEICAKLDRELKKQ